MLLSGGQWISVRVSSGGGIGSGDDCGGIKCHINKSVLLYVTLENGEVFKHEQLKSLKDIKE